MATRFILPGLAAAVLASGYARAADVAAPAAPAEAAAPAAAPQEPCKATIAFPAFNGVIKQNPTPLCLVVPGFGDIYFGGAATGYAYAETNPFPFGFPVPKAPNDKSSRIDFSNVQGFVQKTDGVLQFFVQAGGYSIPSLGAPIFAAPDQTDLLFGPVPVAFAKIAFNDTWSIQGGRMPTLIGAEAPFTYQNLNISRGLLFNQENIINQGVQINYSNGPLSFSGAVTDGYFSGRINYLSGNVAYKFDDANTLTFDAGSNVRRTAKNTFATPLLQSNSTIFNLIYTYSKGPWIVTPYLQYTNVQPDAVLGIPHGASSYGAAILASYAFTENFALAGRAEYETQTGNRALGTGASLLYGPGSSAASFTITPTFTKDRYFLRAEYSRVQLFDITRGDLLAGTLGTGFGRTGNKTSQDRFMVETGFVF